MRVLVTGGRGFSELAFLTAVLDAIHKRYIITSVLHGAGPGTDMMTDYWAQLNDIPIEVFAPDWEKYGDAAEAIRNTVMIATRPELVVVFPGRRHTAICKRQAETAGLKVFVPAYRPVMKVQEEPEEPPKAPPDASPTISVDNGKFDGDSQNL